VETRWEIAYFSKSFLMSSPAGECENVKKQLALLVAVTMQSVPALARDLIDERTHEYTPYGVAIAMIASAQVSEMRCGTIGQINLAIAKAQRLGIPIDLNDKQDFAAVLFEATHVMARLQKDGITAWCNKAAELESFLREP
jgi:hypothetical protein